MKLIEWINGVTKLNKKTMDEFQTNISEAIQEASETGGSSDGILTGSVIGYTGEEIPEGYEEVEDGVSIGGGDSTPIGSGMDYFGTVAPKNYMFADGSAISRSDYAELFNIIGTTYGAGDGSTTFNLPDKRSRVSAMYNSSDSNFNALGKKSGSATHTLTEAQLPKLTGAIHMHSGETATNIASVDGKFSSGLTTQKYKPAGDPVTGASSVGKINWSIGSGTAHNNLQPYIVCNYIIKVK